MGKFRRREHKQCSSVLLQSVKGVDPLWKNALESQNSTLSKVWSHSSPEAVARTLAAVKHARKYILEAIM